MTLSSNSEFLSCYSGPAAELQITEGPAFGRRSDLQISRAPMWNEDTSHRRSSRTIRRPVPCCNSGRGFIPPGHVLHASRSSSFLWPMTTLSAQYDNLCFVGKGGRMVYLNREPVTSEPGKLYRPGYFLKFQQIVEGGLFFHFGGEGSELEAAGPPSSQAEKEVNEEPCGCSFKCSFPEIYSLQGPPRNPQQLSSSCQSSLRRLTFLSARAQKRRIDCLISEGPGTVKTGAAPRRGG